LFIHLLVDWLVYLFIYLFIIPLSDKAKEKLLISS